MRLIFYIFLISQFLNILGLFSIKVKGDPSESNKIKWEKIKENKTKKLEKIIWRSYKNDESYFKNKKEQSSIINKNNPSNAKSVPKSSKNSFSDFTEIEPFLPLNNFLDYGQFKTSIRWKSSFDGGVSGGTGQQNPSFVFDYAISDSSLVSIYITGADDDLYNLVVEKLTIFGKDALI